MAVSVQWCRKATDESLLKVCTSHPCYLNNALLGKQSIFWQMWLLCWTDSETLVCIIISDKAEMTEMHRSQLQTSWFLREILVGAGAEFPWEKSEMNRWTWSGTHLKLHSNTPSLSVIHTNRGLHLLYVQRHTHTHIIQVGRGSRSNSLLRLILIRSKRGQIWVRFDSQKLFSELSQYLFQNTQQHQPQRERVQDRWGFVLYFILHCLYDLLWHPTNSACDKRKVSTCQCQKSSLHDVMLMILALHHSALYCQTWFPVYRDLAWQKYILCTARAQKKKRWVSHTLIIFFCVESRRSFRLLRLRNLSFLLTLPL